MSQIEIPTYVGLVPLPAPYTGAGNSFYTDPNGDIWIARASVNSGNWARARAVMYCRCYRNATYNTPASNTTFAWDTVAEDVYGLFSAPNITIPLNGQWMVGGCVEFSASASDNNAFYLVIGGGPSMRSTLANAAIAAAIRNETTVCVNVTNAPTNFYLQTEYMAAGRAVTVGDPGRSYMFAKYLGA